VDEEILRTAGEVGTRMNPKVAFVQVPKTGTVGIHILIGERCVQIKHEPWTTHTAGEFRQENPDAFIFAFLRNPYDRLVSAYSYLRMPTAHWADVEDCKKYVARYVDFRDFVVRGIGGGEALEQRHCRPQVSWITDSGGLVVTNFLGRFERLQDDFDEVCRRVGWDRMEIPSINASPHGPYDGYYDEETAGIVARIYAKDFELGGYNVRL